MSVLQDPLAESKELTPAEVNFLQDMVYDPLDPQPFVLPIELTRKSQHTSRYASSPTAPLPAQYYPLSPKKTDGRAPPNSLFADLLLTASQSAKSSSGAGGGTTGHTTATSAGATTPHGPVLLTAQRAAARPAPVPSDPVPFGSTRHNSTADNIAARSLSRPVTVGNGVGTSHEAASPVRQSVTANSTRRAVKTPVRSPASERQALQQTVSELESRLQGAVQLQGATSYEVVALTEQLCRLYNSAAMKLAGNKKTKGQDPDVALQLLQKAQLLTEPDSVLASQPDLLQRLLAITHNNLGCYYKRHGDAAIALDHLNTAADIERSLNSSGGGNGGGGGGLSAGTLLNLAAVLSALGRHKQSLARAVEATEAASAAAGLPVGLRDLEEALLAPHPHPATSVEDSWSAGVLAQLRWADAEAATHLAMAHFNRAVELEHLAMVGDALRAYAVAETLATHRFGRGADLAITFGQAHSAYKIKAAKLQRGGKLQPAAAGAASTGRTFVRGTTPSSSGGTSRRASRSSGGDGSGARPPAATSSPARSGAASVSPGNASPASRPASGAGGTASGAGGTPAGRTAVGGATGRNVASSEAGGTAAAAAAAGAADAGSAGGDGEGHAGGGESGEEDYEDDSEQEDEAEPPASGSQEQHADVDADEGSTHPAEAEAETAHSAAPPPMHQEVSAQSESEYEDLFDDE